jgi:histidinol-phosphate aminotransferase
VRLLSDAEGVHARLKQHGVLVKNLHKPGSALENCLRITVGKPEENQTLLKALNLSLDVKCD